MYNEGDYIPFDDDEVRESFGEDYQSIVIHVEVSDSIRSKPINDLDPVKTEKLIRSTGLGSDVINQSIGKTWLQFYNDLNDPRHLIQMINDRKLRILIGAMCAKSIVHHSEDSRSIEAVEGAIDYGMNFSKKLSKEESLIAEKDLDEYQKMAFEVTQEFADFSSLGVESFDEIPFEAVKRIASLAAFDCLTDPESAILCCVQGWACVEMNINPSLPEIDSINIANKKMTKIIKNTVTSDLLLLMLHMDECNRELDILIEEN